MPMRICELFARHSIFLVMQNEPSEVEGIEQSEPLVRSHLSIKDLGLKRNGRWLFRNLNWEIPRGSVVAVVGPSGVGKSSLLNCLAGLLRAERRQADVFVQCRLPARSG